MGQSMAHIAHQPGPVCLESGVGRWLVGVVGLGGWSCTSAHRRRVGRFFHSSALVKRAVSGPSRELLPKAMRGVFGLAPLFPGGPGGTKPLLFTTRKPSQMYTNKAVVVHVTRW
jgi:hypothetical protein